MVILPEFGRDPDGSNTNGFFNHRANMDSTQRHLDDDPGSSRRQAPDRSSAPFATSIYVPTLAGLLGCPSVDSQGNLLTDFRVSGSGRECVRP